MPDTGAPWYIPYVETTDLVSDWPSDSLALANAIDAGLDAAGGLVDVHYIEKTDTFSASVNAGDSTAVTGLSLSNIAVADASHRLIISGWFGVSGTNQQFANVGIGVYDGSAFLGIGDADGSRTRVTAANAIIRNANSWNERLNSNMAFTIVHTPGDTTARTYSLYAFNLDPSTSRTIYVNRSGDVYDNDARTPLSASALLIQEIKV